MIKSFKKKVVIFLVSFALANIALHAIINFHFYRIFEKELVKIDNNFIKKDDSYLIIKPFDTNSFIHGLDFSFATLEYNGVICTSKFGSIIFDYTPINTNPYCNYFSDISPSRGSPINA